LHSKGFFQQRQQQFRRLKSKIGPRFDLIFYLIIKTRLIISCVKILEGEFIKLEDAFAFYPCGQACIE